MNNYNGIMGKDYGNLRLFGGAEPKRKRQQAPSHGSITPFTVKKVYTYYRAQLWHDGIRYTYTKKDRQECVIWLNEKLAEFGINYKHK